MRLFRFDFLVKNFVCILSVRELPKPLYLLPSLGNDGSKPIKKSSNLDEVAISRLYGLSRIFSVRHLRALIQFEFKDSIIKWVYNLREFANQD